MASLHYRPVGASRRHSSQRRRRLYIALADDVNSAMQLGSGRRLPLMQPLGGRAGWGRNGDKWGTGWGGHYHIARLQSPRCLMPRCPGFRLMSTQLSLQGSLAEKGSKKEGLSMAV
eukprot:6213543-Pleurochrysis_carterae.AAC.3